MNWQPCKMLASALMALCSTPALAANILLAPLGNDPTHTIVFVEGRLMAGDDAAFRSRVSSLTKAIVSFNSEGGNILAAIAIGKIIRLKSFITAVPDEQRCASACALAWLGGTTRLMGNGAHIGFHAAHTNKDGRDAEISGFGNALVGAYLNQIGLSEEAIVYITKAPPTDMTWLTPRDTERFSIDVGSTAFLSRFEQQALKKAASATRPNADMSPAETVDLRFPADPVEPAVAMASVAPVAMAFASADSAISFNPRPIAAGMGTSSPEPQVTATTNSTGGFLVQVASQRSESEALSAFRSLQAKFPYELGGRQSVIRRADLGSKGVYYRANVGLFASAQEANRFCASYKAAGGQCAVPNN